MKLKEFFSVFNNTQNSYKFYWWLSIIDIVTFEDKTEIFFDEIIFKLISKIWFPVNYFKVSFGSLDQCSKHLKEIKEIYSLQENLNESDLKAFLLENRNTPLLKKITAELTRYVPYRFIRPWYSKETRGIKDAMVNSTILINQDSKAPYTIFVDQSKILINKDWFTWIRENYTLIKSFTSLELIKYLERENPNIPNITKKLEKPNRRNLLHQKKYWEKYILNNPLELDVFTNRPLKYLNNFSLDHFLPWSFVTHDLLWNLHPVDKKINSSKNNFLPNKFFLGNFSDLQFSFSKFLIENKFNKQLESYYSFLNCSKEEFEKISKENFIKKMDKAYSPLFEISLNMGFLPNWTPKGPPNFLQ